MAENIKILHIDQSKEFREIVSRLIKKEDPSNQIISESEPENVFKALENRDIDCIISSYEMEETNGLKLLEEVKQKHPHTPFILLTDNGNEELASEAISKGVNDYIRKKDILKQRELILNRIKNSIEREKAEKALKESEQKYRTLVEQGNTAVYIYRGTEFLYVNPKVEEITGYSEEELLDMVPHTLVHPDDKERLKRYSMQRLEGKNPPRRHTAKIINREGETVHCRFEVSEITYNEKRAFIVSVVDITERVKARKQLEKSKKKFKTVFENSQEGLIFIKDTEITKCNQRMCELLEKDREEIKGKKLSDFAPEKQPDGTKSDRKEQQKLKKAKKEEKTTFKWEAVDATGKKFTTEISLNKLELEDGTYIQGFIRDISECKEKIENLEQTDAKI